MTDATDDPVDAVNLCRLHDDGCPHDPDADPPPPAPDLEPWRRVWRDGIAPLLSVAHLDALKTALETDDPRLMQGSTTTPPPLMCVMDWPVEAACALGFCGWQGEQLESVAAVHEHFCRVCFDADQRLGEPAEVRHFLNWFDATPRHEMRAAMLPEVVAALVTAKLNADPRPPAPRSKAA